MPARYPERIVCLTEETTETLYLLGEERRIVGISGYTVRPPRARHEKPRVSAFLSARIDKILALKPDLVLGFSDLQADIARDLAKAGMNVVIFNQRSVDEILSMIQMLASLVGAPEKGAALVAASRDRPARGERGGERLCQQAPRLLRGVGRADDQRHPLGERAGRDRGRRGHVLRAVALAGGQRTHRCEAPTRSYERNPDVMLASWCGKKFRPERVAARAGLAGGARGAGTASSSRSSRPTSCSPGRRRSPTACAGCTRSSGELVY